MMTFQGPRMIKIAILATAALSCSAATAGPAGANGVGTRNLAFYAGEQSTVRADVSGGKAVFVDGANAIIDVPADDLEACSFAFEAVDTRAHRIRFVFGGLGVVDVTETDEDGRLAVAFAGASGYGARLYEKGELVRSLAGQTKPLMIPGLSAKHDGPRESLDLELAWGKTAPNTWSISLSRGSLTVVLSPEGVDEKTTGAPPRITVQTTGLSNGFTLVPRAIAFRSHAD